MIKKMMSTDYLIVLKEFQEMIIVNHLVNFNPTRRNINASYFHFLIL